MGRIPKRAGLKKLSSRRNLKKEYALSRYGYRDIYRALWPKMAAGTRLVI
jgi:hypothetical protein